LKLYESVYSFFVGAEKIAEKTNSAALFPIFIKVHRGCYELQFEKVRNKWTKNENFSIINEYAQLLEDTISKYPELWLWSHRRWKLSSPPILQDVNTNEDSEKIIS
jgi:KDO2-lipid IV(A) lauroyltransferase